MRNARYFFAPILMVLCLLLAAGPSGAALSVQCPGDTNGDLIPDQPGFENVVCMHITCGDGVIKLADGKDEYIFSFSRVDQTVPGFNLKSVPAEQSFKVTSPAPPIVLEQGQELYLTLTNAGFAVRVDLFDTHSVHWHGFPNAAPIFDGLPEPSPTPNMGSSFTYYYKAEVPGTYFYHCHVEAAEHMQMGMIGNLYVRPLQNGEQHGTDSFGQPFTKFAYNDGDGRTGYHVEVPIQLVGHDSNFHDASEAIQPLPFANMYDNYPMINGRGYPDTVNPGDILNREGFAAQPATSTDSSDNTIPYSSTVITATSGQRILFRVSNVSTTHIYAMATTLGVPMKVVGRGAAILVGPTGQDTSYNVNVLNVGGGQHFDVIVDTTGVAAGTYFLYTTNLENLSNGNQERGGIMAEIVISN